MWIFIILSYLLLALSSFKQLHINVKYLFPSLLNPGLGERLVSGGLIILSDIPLDFYSERRPVLRLNLRHLFIGWNTK